VTRSFASGTVFFPSEHSPNPASCVCDQWSQEVFTPCPAPRFFPFPSRFRVFDLVPPPRKFKLVPYQYECALKSERGISLLFPPFFFLPLCVAFYSGTAVFPQGVTLPLARRSRQVELCPPKPSCFRPFVQRSSTSQLIIFSCCSPFSSPFPLPLAARSARVSSVNLPT